MKYVCKYYVNKGSIITVFAIIKDNREASKWCDILSLYTFSKLFISDILKVSNFEIVPIDQKCKIYEI